MKNYISPQIIEHKQTTTYSEVQPCSNLGQTQKVAVLDRSMESQTPSKSVNGTQSTSFDLQKKNTLINLCTNSFPHNIINMDKTKVLTVSNTLLAKKLDRSCWLKTVTLKTKIIIGTPVSSTNKTDRHDITEILLKVALNTITP